MTNGQMATNNGGDSTMVLKDLRQHLDELASVGEQLNRLSDAFTDELRTVEAELAKLRLGLEVEDDHPIETEVVEEVETDGETIRIEAQTFLAYGRRGSSGDLIPVRA